MLLAYTLDAVGNRSALGVDGVATKYSYDAVNELTNAQLGLLRSTWAFDAVGNRLKQSSPFGTTTYTYDANDRLLLAGPASVTYDADGNQTSASGFLRGETVSYQYDAANRLIAAIGPKVTSTFAYDGDGNRVSQSVGPGTYNYVNDVATDLPVVLQESGPDGNISFAYGQGLISESGSTFSNFYHYDGLGSVIALSDSKGLPAAAYVYDPWGNSLFSVSDDVGTRNKFRFTGQAFDPGTQLYYLHARYYDPTVGRFVSPDPRPRAILSSAPESRYTYAADNPITLSDPSGLSPACSGGQGYVDIGLAAGGEAVGGNLDVEVDTSGNIYVTIGGGESAGTNPAITSGSVTLGSGTVSTGWSGTFSVSGFLFGGGGNAQASLSLNGSWLQNPLQTSAAPGVGTPGVSESAEITYTKKLSFQAQQQITQVVQTTCRAGAITAAQATQLISLIRNQLGK